MMDLLPDKSGLWFRSGEDRWYTNESLYDYIDGGAELFISYGFEKVLSRTYIAEDQPDVTVDVFDMISSENAYGVFCHIRDGLNTEFGQGSQVYDEAILFWKDHYYVSVTADGITLASKETIRSIAGHIETAIKKNGPLPEILNLLPDQGVDASTLVFFKHYVWLNSLYYIGDDNFLGIDEHSDALLSRITINGQEVICLVIEYPSPTGGRKAASGFVDVFEMEPGNPAFTRIEDGTWLGCGYRDHVFVAVFKAPSGKPVESLIRQILNKKL